MKDVRFAKLVLLVNALVPGAVLLWDWNTGQASADPVNYAILTTGLLALIFLTLTLAVTPLRKVTGWQWLFHMRRRLGLCAFFYALGHFSIFFLFDRGMSVSSTLSEMVKRPYLIVGSIGLFAMAPLAATSLNGAIKWMGPKRWKALHRLAYVAAGAGVVHYFMQVKSDTRQPIAFGLIIGLLLAYRVVAWAIERTRRWRGESAAAPAAAEDARWKGRLRVERITQETPNVRTFRLAPSAGGALPFTYQPGQYLTLTLKIGERTVRRSYTIASTPSRGGCCELTIKREEQGLVSRHMHDTIKEGDELEVMAPGGRFTFTGSEAGRIVLLAAGVGITPLMSILRYLSDQSWGGKVHLIYSCRTESDIIFRGELEALRERFGNLQVTVTLTRADETWAGERGRIDAARVRRVVGEVAGALFYLCGPAEMIAATRAMLREMGVVEGSIRTESFGVPQMAGGDDGATYTVTFARSGKMAQVGSGRPLLTVAEALGIAVDSECRSGICGKCRCRLTAGSVSMAVQDGLDAADRRGKVILLCQARALEDVTVEA